MKLNQLRNPDNGTETTGDYHLIDDNGNEIFTCVTLELPFKQNKNGISCIPAGDYPVEKVPASEHISYPHFAIRNVAGREGICIHIANYAAGKKVQLLGCTAVGMSFSDLDKDGNLDTVSSKIAFDKLYALTPDKFELSINYRQPAAV